MDTFKLSIFSPERKLVESELVKSILLTTGEGEIEIFLNFFRGGQIKQKIQLKS